MSTTILKANKRTMLLNSIIEQLNELGIEEVKRYKNDFSFELDYNLVQYGNLLIYYYDIRDMYKECGYKVKNYNDTQIWNKYKYDTRCAVQKLLKANA